MKIRSAVILGVVATLVVASVGFVLSMRSASPDPLTRPTQGKAQLAFQAGRYTHSLAMCTELLEKRPGSNSLLMLAAESATKLAEFDDALAFYARVPDASATDAATARWAAGEIYFHLGQATAAVEQLEAGLKLNSNMPLAHRRLVDVLHLCGRRFEAYPHLVALIKVGHVTIEDLLLVGNVAKLYDAPAEVRRFLAVDRTDLLPTLGTVVAHVKQSEFEQASKLLPPLLAQYPGLIETRVQQGLVMAKLTPEDLPKWNAELPVSADAYPEVWVLRSQMLASVDRPAAVRCLAEAIARDANHLVAHSMLAQLLKLDGRDALAAKAADRASRLQRLNIALEQVYEAREHVEKIQEAAELSLSLGRVWEATSWAAYAASIDPTLVWPRQVTASVKAAAELSALTPFTVRGSAAMELVGLRGEYDLPDWQASYELLAQVAADAAQVTEPSSAVRIEDRISAIRFSDVAAESGLDFTYDNNLAEAGQGRKIFETTGGGVGVLDFDCDGFPDVVFAQAGSFSEIVNRPSDQLFRNVPQAGGEPVNRRFLNATQASRLSGTGFSQGVAVGDVDGDGFDDIYVCNIGVNSLWLNQGDGTFASGAGILPSGTGAQWTSSALIADLDGDGAAEIYDANYVYGPDVYTRVCQVGGLPRGCSPLVFFASPDMILTPQDSGQFSVGARLEGEDQKGNSLGVVAFSRADALKPSVFVSVDQQANLLLGPVGEGGTPVRGDLAERFAYENLALVSGVAYDESGAAQACMGIAAGDVNADGEVDLCVTNFYLEYNTLYLQADGFFEDVTAQSGTAGATRPMLGFGCQFADLQLDGLTDMVVLNGHIDDHTHTGVAEQMPAQVFAGLPGERFGVAAPETAGQYFSLPRLGRALASLDFDADGLVDFVAGDLEVPAALLHNESEPVGASLVVRLVGTTADRNAFFSRVTLVGANADSGAAYRSSQQLIAGGGYQAANQRQLVFAVPAGTVGLSLEVTWPGGVKEQFSVPEDAGVMTLVEGMAARADAR